MYFDYMPPGHSDHPLNTGRDRDILVVEEEDVLNESLHQEIIESAPRTTDEEGEDVLWAVFWDKPKVVRDFREEGLRGWLRHLQRSSQESSDE